MTPEGKKKALDELAQQISTCTKCRLYESATNAVPGEGNPDSETMFIGEGPGFHEDQQGKPFVGKAGMLLEFLLKQIGYKREDVWIGNVIKHRPPKNRDPLPDEIKACKPHLTKQIEIIRPKLIVTLGRFAMSYFMPNAKISEAHGKPHNLIKFILYPLYHPAAGLRNGAIKKVLIQEFLKIPEILNMQIENLEPIIRAVKKEEKKQERLF